MSSIRCRTSRTWSTPTRWSRYGVCSPRSPSPSPYPTGVCSTSAGATNPEPDVAAEEQSDQAPPKGHLEGLTHQVHMSVLDDMVSFSACASVGWCLPTWFTASCSSGGRSSSPFSCYTSRSSRPKKVGSAKT
ncbi:uncharacterized protein LOC125524846 isoform X2 [Triticum urartu]|uniref:uncharacterized protein LOC125524846 isoform X2 n=1 Tax=Triticum urartu TaxID=4572 RepID=UPI002043B38C|nr:uncharacterized protein LOC125524846 isoform X2 [Triticum urartu]